METALSGTVQFALWARPKSLVLRIALPLPRRLDNTDRVYRQTGPTTLPKSVSASRPGRLWAKYSRRQLAFCPVLDDQLRITDGNLYVSMVKECRIRENWRAFTKSCTYRS